MIFLTEYWPFWLGGVSLAVVPLVYGCERFGISGIWERTLYRRETIDIAESNAFASDPEMVKNSLEGKNSDPEKMNRFRKEAVRVWLGQISMLVGISLGGVCDAFFRDDLSLKSSLSAVHVEMFGDGLLSYVVLFVGGLLVGWGTRLAGGCTSGHGLTGISAFQKFSFLATGVFFGTAIIVTLSFNLYFGRALPW